MLKFQVKKYSAENDDPDADDDDDVPHTVAFWGTVNEALGNADESQLPPEDDEKVRIPAVIKKLLYRLPL